MKPLPQPVFAISSTVRPSRSMFIPLYRDAEGRINWSIGAPISKK